MTGRSSLFRACRFEWLIAPLRIHELSVIAEADVIACEVVPDKAGGGIVDVGHVAVEGKLVSHLSLKIVGALFAAVGDLPGFLVVIGRDGGRGPEVAVAGNFYTVVEVVEHAELERQLMFVGGDV